MITLGKTVLANSRAFLAKTFARANDHQISTMQAIASTGAMFCLGCYGGCVGVDFAQELFTKYHDHQREISVREGRLVHRNVSPLIRANIVVLTVGTGMAAGGLLGLIAGIHRPLVTTYAMAVGICYSVMC